MVLFCNFAFYKSHNMMDCFSYFTFACFQCSFDDIVCALENDSGIANGKYKLASRPFAFDLYENEPLSGGAHSPSPIFQNESKRRYLRNVLQLCRRLVHSCQCIVY